MHARPTRVQTLRTALVWLALWLLPVAALVVLLGPDDVFSRIALFFSQMAAVTFGGAYAVLAYVAQEAVEGYHWLSAREMLDGFVPCFLWIFLGAPFIERLRGNAAVAGALSAITAAVVGVVLNLAIWFMLHTLFRQTVPVHAGPLDFDLPVLASLDPWAVLLATGAAIAIFALRAGVIVTLLGTAAAGVGLHLLGRV